MEMLLETLLKGGVPSEKPMKLAGAAQLQDEDIKLRAHDPGTILNKDEHGSMPPRECGWKKQNISTGELQNQRPERI